MAGDVNRLFSMINQANLPYQVFEQVFDDTAPVVEAQAALSEGEAMALALRNVFGCPPAANEDAVTVEAGFLKAYCEPAPAPEPQAAPVAEKPAGARLDDIFRRMVRTA
ncbi:hypothetical protein [Caulobacter endophyticus]|uniref:Uncharacterized protein n=1 Tax=Caulobacter endophyticus TaxID=2172652 RepID=A0A2T9K411_9CAUL|nr:hypothetical protein [Caulobacter endophyticus]PVM90712.1 hypothetical protein DDF67_09815 [Caulobacter endophyticus]